MDIIVHQHHYSVMFYTFQQLCFDKVFILIFLCFHRPSTRLVYFYFSCNFRLVSQNTIQQHPQDIHQRFPFHCVFLCGRWKKKIVAIMLKQFRKFYSWERVRVVPSDQSPRILWLSCCVLVYWSYTAGGGAGISASMDSTQFDCWSCCIAKSQKEPLLFDSEWDTLKCAWTSS